MNDNLTKKRSAIVCKETLWCATEGKMVAWTSSFEVAFIPDNQDLDVLSMGTAKPSNQKRKRQR